MTGMSRYNEAWRATTIICNLIAKQVLWICDICERPTPHSNRPQGSSYGILRIITKMCFQIQSMGQSRGGGGCERPAPHCPKHPAPGIHLYRKNVLSDSEHGQEIGRHRRHWRRKRRKSILKPLKNHQNGFQNRSIVDESSRLSRACVFEALFGGPGRRRPSPSSTLGSLSRIIFDRKS